MGSFLRLDVGTLASTSQRPFTAFCASEPRAPSCPFCDSEDKAVVGRDGALDAITLCRCEECLSEWPEKVAEEGDEVE